MKSVAVALALFFAGAHAAVKPISQEVADWSVREHFAQFEAKFNKVYASAEEREMRVKVFLSTLERVVADNQALTAEGKDAIHGITQFADMTEDEFLAKIVGNKMVPASTNATVATPTKKATASAFDWRDSGVVTDVKNQGYCGSCWAHSAVETLESQYAINSGSLTSLSTQQVTSCDSTDGGCNGGWYYTAWEDYVEANGGLNTEANYPYDDATFHGSASTCDSGLESAVVSGTGVSGWSYATTPCNSFRCNNQDEDTLKDNLVSTGPISIACDASKWSSYTGGVMTSSSCKSGAFNLDHAIQLVGYNEDADTPYWIVRNSWDTTWGNDGYIYLAMGDNTCGIADAAATVTL